ncbi:MAG: hypothetical protein PUD24_01065, partial [Oscillospiraceae bacterium]|nr:hypothetical protein [Oscillospiraceae bacterium]
PFASVQYMLFSPSVKTAFCHLPHQREARIKEYKLCSICGQCVVTTLAAVPTEIVRLNTQ